MRPFTAGSHNARRDRSRLSRRIGACLASTARQPSPADPAHGHRPNHPICSCHHAPRGGSTNSVVRVMLIMYVKCVSVLGHLAHFSDLRLFVSTPRVIRKIAGHRRGSSSPSRTRTLWAWHDAASLAADRAEARRSNIRSRLGPSARPGSTPRTASYGRSVAAAYSGTCSIFCQVAETSAAR